jgi:hypothetical protein
MRNGRNSGAGTPPASSPAWRSAAVWNATPAGSLASLASGPDTARTNPRSADSSCSIRKEGVRFFNGTAGAAGLRPKMAAIMAAHLAGAPMRAITRESTQRENFRADEVQSGTECDLL